MGAMGAMVLTTTTTREFSVFPNILKKSPIAHVCDGRDGRDWRDGRYFQYPPNTSVKDLNLQGSHSLTICGLSPFCASENDCNRIQLIASLAVFSLFMILQIAGNLIYLVTYLKHPKLRKKRHYLIR